MTNPRRRPAGHQPGREVIVRVHAGSAVAGDPTFELQPARPADATDERPIVVVRPPGSGTTKEFEVVVAGWRFELEVEDARQAELRAKARRGTNDLASHGPVEVRAIIPGRVVSVDVGVGDPVEAGGHLLVLEAMKMQNELAAPAGGRIARIAVSAGATVDRGDLLVVIEPAAREPVAWEPGAGESGAGEPSAGEPSAAEPGT